MLPIFMLLNELCPAALQLPFFDWNPEPAYIRLLINQFDITQLLSCRCCHTAYYRLALDMINCLLFHLSNVGVILVMVIPVAPYISP